MKISRIVEMLEGDVLPFKRPDQKTQRVTKVPLDQVFKSKPREKLTANSYKKESYSWGEIRRIEVGKMGTMIIHPQNWWTIQRIPEGQSHLVKDETGSEWDITHGRDDKLFVTQGSIKAEGSWKEMLEKLA